MPKRYDHFLAAPRNNGVGSVSAPALLAAVLVLMMCLGIGFNPVREALAAQGAPGRYAIIVGVSKYKNPRYNLNFADRDAQAFYDFLRTPQGGGFHPDDMVLLLNERATSSNLRTALGTFLPRRAKPDDLVVIFFSGHGDAAPQNPEALYLLTHEADITNLAGTSFPMDEMKLFLRRSIKSRRVVMLVDSCRAGGIQLMGAGGSKDNVLYRYLGGLTKARQGLVSISASGASQASLESSSYGGGHGVFTYFLLRGLKQDAEDADTNEDGMVDVAEIYEYVRANVKEATGNRQIPDKTGDLMVGIPLGAIRGGYEMPAGSQQQPYTLAGQSQQQAPPPPSSLVSPPRSAAPGNDQQQIRVVMGMFREVPNGPPVPVRPNDTLRSGDGYFFLLRVTSQCYVYLFQVDATGAVYRLFPNAQFNTPPNPIPPGQKIVLPNAREAFYLDNTIGQEEIYLFASRDRVPELEGLETGQRSDLQQEGIQLMGPAGVRQRVDQVQHNQATVSAPLDEMVSSANFLHKMAFRHQ